MGIAYNYKIEKRKNYSLYGYPKSVKQQNPFGMNTKYDPDYNPNNKALFDFED